MQRGASVFKFHARNGRPRENVSAVGGAGGVVSDSLLRVDFDEELYEVEIGSNKAFGSPYLRFQYSSLTTPARDLDLDTRRARGDVASRDTL